MDGRMKSGNGGLALVVALIGITSFGWCEGPSAADAESPAVLDVAMSVDDTFELYVSTDDAMQGMFVGGAGDWGRLHNFSCEFVPGVVNYIHVVGHDVHGVVGGFAGLFELTDDRFEFENGTQTLDTADFDEWQVSRTGFGLDYEMPTLSQYTWHCSHMDGRAIWTNNGHDVYTARYFSVPAFPTGVTLALPPDLKIGCDDELRATVEVSISGSEQVKGARIAIDLDPRLQYVPGSARWDDTLTESWFWAINDARPGKLIMSGAGSQLLSADSGVLIRFEVELASTTDVPCGDEIPLPFDVALTRVNDGRIPCFTEDGLIRVNCPPESDIISPSDGYVHVDQSAPVCFVGEGLDPDGDLPLAYQWDFGGPVEPEDQETGQNPCVTYCEPGVYTVTLTVIDALGCLDPSPAQIMLRVNSCPNGEIVDPSDDIEINLGREDEVVIRFVGEAHDPDNDLPLEYEWDFDGAAPHSDMLNPDPVRFCRSGQYDVTFTVTDALGVADPTPAVRTVHAVFRWGDANNDDIVGTLDASRILAWDALMFDDWDEWPCRYAQPESPEAADVDPDDVVGVNDAFAILTQSVGLLDYFPADVDQDEWGPDEGPPAGLRSAGRSAEPARAVALEIAARSLAPGQETAVRVVIDDASALKGFRLVVNLSQALEYVKDSASVADTLFAGSPLAVNSKRADRLVVSCVALDRAKRGSGPLLTFRLRARANLPNASRSPIPLDIDQSLSRLNDGAVPAAFLDNSIEPAIALDSPRHGEVLSGDGATFDWELADGVRARRIEFGRQVRDGEVLRARRRFRLHRAQTSWSPNAKQCRRIRRVAGKERGRVFWRVTGRNEQGQRVASDIRAFRVGPMMAPPGSITTVEYHDINASGAIDQGDELRVRFVNPGDAARVSLSDLALPVPGDTFGQQATALVSGETLVIRLGQYPFLTVEGVFSEASAHPGQPSGLGLTPDAAARLSRGALQKASPRDIVLGS